MRVLVIGGTGFIGTHTARALVAAGHRVAVLHRGHTRAELLDTIEYIQGNRDDLTSTTGRLRRWNPEVVVDMVPLTEAHARAVLDVFDGIARKVIAISSFDVYRAFEVMNRLADGPLQPIPIREDSELRTNLFLARDLPNRPSDRPPDYEKILVERVYVEQSGPGPTVLRLPIVYGPGDVRRRRTAPYVTRMLDGRPAIVMGESESNWTATRGYVENIAAAIAEAVVNDDAVGRTYNIGDVALSELQWAKRLAEAIGCFGRIVVMPDAQVPESRRFAGNAAQHWVLDTDRIRHELGFEPPIALEEAVRRTANGTAPILRRQDHLRQIMRPRILLCRRCHRTRGNPESGPHLPFLILDSRIWNGSGTALAGHRRIGKAGQLWRQTAADRSARQRPRTQLFADSSVAETPAAVASCG